MEEQETEAANTLGSLREEQEARDKRVCNELELRLSWIQERVEEARGDIMRHADRMGEANERLQHYRPMGTGHCGG